MEFVSGSLLYVMLWWVVFFMVLPWGVQPHPSPLQGCDPGAPESPRLGLKIVITTSIAAALWGVDRWLGVVKTFLLTS